MGGFLVSTGIYVDGGDECQPRPVRRRAPSQETTAEAITSALALDPTSAGMQWQGQDPPAKPRYRKAQDDFVFVNLSLLPIDFPSNTWDIQSPDPKRPRPTVRRETEVSPLQSLTDDGSGTFVAAVFQPQSYVWRTTRKAKTWNEEILQPWTIGTIPLAVDWGQSSTPTRRPFPRQNSQQTTDTPPPASTDSPQFVWFTGESTQPTGRRPRLGPSQDTVSPLPEMIGLIVSAGAYTESGVSLIVPGPYAVMAGQVSWLGAVQADAQPG